MHLFGGIPDFDSLDLNDQGHLPTEATALEARLSVVEQELTTLKAAFEKLMKELY